MGLHFTKWVLAFHEMPRAASKSGGSRAAVVKLRMRLNRNWTGVCCVRETFWEFVKPVKDEMCAVRQNDMSGCLKIAF